MERILKEQLDGGAFSKVTPTSTKRMKAVRGKGNKTTERRFRAMLIRAGMKGWRLNPPGLVGSPDVLFSAARVVVFLDGCYWHGCPRCGHIPTVNKGFWSTKIQRNRERDQRYTQQLEADGYRVLRFWEHELAESPAGCIEAVKTAVETGAN